MESQCGTLNIFKLGQGEIFPRDGPNFFLNFPYQWPNFGPNFRDKFSINLVRMKFSHGKFYPGEILKYDLIDAVDEKW